MGFSAYFVFNEAVKGGVYVLVPDVTGLPITSAANILAQAGLELGTQKQISNTRVPEYHVIVQRPSANRVVRAGRKVSLSISAGSHYENAPSLVGRRLESAKQELEGTRLRLGSIARLPDTAPADTILAQDPPANAPVNTGGEIHLLVSDGPEAKQIFMPDLLGRTLEEVQLLLARLDVSAVPYKVERAGEEYEVVLAQRPAPGTLLHEHQEVTFDVRLLPSSFLPNARRKVSVRYTVPRRAFPAAVRVELVDQRGTRSVIYPQLRDYVGGRPPTHDSGTTITFPEIAFSNEATVEFSIDGALHTSYYFEGDAKPVVTINDLGSGERTGIVQQEDLNVTPSSPNTFRPRFRPRSP